MKLEGVGSFIERNLERSVVVVLPAEASCALRKAEKALLREERRGTKSRGGKLSTQSVNLSEKISTLGRRPLVECLFGE